MTFEEELKDLINKYSMENEFNTPDFILARFIRKCLELFSEVVLARDYFYSFRPFKKEGDK